MLARWFAAPPPASQRAYFFWFLPGGRGGRHLGLGAGCLRSRGSRSRSHRNSTDTRYSCFLEPAQRVVNRPARLYMRSQSPTLGGIDVSKFAQSQNRADRQQSELAVPAQRFVDRRFARGSAAGRYVLFDQNKAQQNALRQNMPAAYAQDTIRVSRRLTLNAGIRWEPMPMAYDNFTRGPRFNLQWLNPAAFAANPTVTYGNPGARYFAGAAYFQLRRRSFRIFPIRERLKLEARAEAFTSSITRISGFAISGAGAIGGSVNITSSTSDSSRRRPIRASFSSR